MSPDPRTLDPLLQKSIFLSEQIMGILNQEKLLDNAVEELMAKRESTLQELANLTKTLIDYDANVGVYRKKMRSLMQADEKLRKALSDKKNALDTARETQVHEQKADNSYKSGRNTSVFIQGKLEA